MMIALFLLSVSYLVAMIFVALSDRKIDKHENCLHNIERIEREIWPEKFEKQTTRELVYGSAQVWQVNDLAIRGIIRSSLSEKLASARGEKLPVRKSRR
jgi:hypothetical protein